MNSFLYDTDHLAISVPIRLLLKDGPRGAGPENAPPGRGALEGGVGGSGGPRGSREGSRDGGGPDLRGPGPGGVPGGLKWGPPARSRTN